MRVERIDLSVVVAAPESERTLLRCLDALAVACTGLAAEVLVVHSSQSGLAHRVSSAHPRVRLLAAPAGALVPELWGLGLAAARGEAVAFTTGHCVVPSGWAHALLGALARGATGAGGALRLATGTGPVDWAVYLLRYSAFLPPLPDGEVAELPGENAAYQRSALLRHAVGLGEGFWEVEFHRRIRAEGGRLVGVPEATVDLGPSFSFASFFRQRFQHGAHFGEYRVSTAGAPRWRGVVAAPLVPFLLSARILRRVAPRSELRTRALLALPLLLPLACAWAAGEAWGALRAGRAPRLQGSPA